MSREGSVDWLCWPRFDSPSLFAALLDETRGGSFSIAPTGRHATERKYVDHTNVLQAVFHTDNGVLRLTDLMPVRDEGHPRSALLPTDELLREMHCEAGEVEIELRYQPRPDYGRADFRLQDRGALGIHLELSHGAAVVLRADVPVAVDGGRHNVVARFRMRAGETRYVSLSFTEREPVAYASLGDAPSRVRETTEWWSRWSGRCRYDGPYREMVVRSALLLKLLTFAPSGAVVAAPTTSLPEDPGGVRNWDYRFCWLRDASMTLQALFDLGYPTEGEAFLSWLIHTTRMTHPGLRVLYTVYGERPMPEQELPHLDGFEGSRPVRIGNAAAQQWQLDLYGEVLDAVYEFVRRGGRLDRMTTRLLEGLGKTVIRVWETPDQGIWEPRNEPRHHTHSKMMCWVALDRLLKLNQEVGLRIPVDRYRQVRSAIAQAVDAQGYDPVLGSYVQSFGHHAVDASLLLAGRYGFCAPDSPRMRGTIRRIAERLGRDGLIRRYDADDGVAGGEGAFLICSFWMVTAENAAGGREPATRRFEELLKRANDVGLYAEEMDPASGRALGNFPQAFSHVGLIDAALALVNAPAGPAGKVDIGRDRNHAGEAA